VMNFTTVCLGLKSALDPEYPTLALRPVTYKYQGTTPRPVYCPDTVVIYLMHSGFCIQCVTCFNSKCSEFCLQNVFCMYRGADKSLARPISRCILFDFENISFDASLVIYI